MYWIISSSIWLKSTSSDTSVCEQSNCYRATWSSKGNRHTWLTFNTSARHLTSILPISFQLRSNLVSVYVKWANQMDARREQIQSNLVGFQYNTEASCSLIADLVGRQLKCGQCLRRMMRRSDVRRRAIRSDSVDQQCPTQILCSDGADSIAPQIKWNECLERAAVTRRLHRREELFSYSIDLQRFCKITNFFIVDIIARQMQCRESLWMVNIVIDEPREARECLTWLIVSASARYWTPVSPVWFFQSVNVVSVYQRQEWRFNNSPENSCLTWLIFNASARDWRPSFPSSLCDRESTVSP